MFRLPNATNKQTEQKIRHAAIGIRNKRTDTHALIAPNGNCNAVQDQTDREQAADTPDEDVARLVRFKRKLEN